MTTENRIEKLFSEFLATKNFDHRKSFDELSVFEQRRLFNLTDEFFASIEQYLNRIGIAVR